MDASPDLPVRVAAFEWLREQSAAHGDVLPRELLAAGFVFDNRRVPLVGPQGIFKPAVCRLPLSITSIVEGGPYDDRIENDVLRYAYRGTDPQKDADHPDNVGLRLAAESHAPLVLFLRLRPGRYLARYPVFVIGDDRRQMKFDIDVSEDQWAEGPSVAENRNPILRAYKIGSFRRRVHQRSFREQVLVAYREQCALCRLRHVELLDAAHIIGDAEDDGEPLVSNGLALCKLHHAAFDSFFFAVRPDYVIEVRKSILDEVDGPMLLVGLKQIHEQRIQLPRAAGDRPDPARLERRYEKFRVAS